MGNGLLKFHADPRRIYGRMIAFMWAKAVLMFTIENFFGNLLSADLVSVLRCHKFKTKLSFLEMVLRKVRVYKARRLPNTTLLLEASI